MVRKQCVECSLGYVCKEYDDENGETLEDILGCQKYKTAETIWEVHLSR